MTFRPHGIQTKPEPCCPDCGARMVLRKPKTHQSWEPFWGCRLWPDCDGTRDVGDDGKPVYDEVRS